eukprot:g8418.t1
MHLPNRIKRIGKGVKEDFEGLCKCYNDDWREGFNSTFRILAPASYVFFASAIPALALGEQISSATDGALNGISILASAAICGIIQAVLGGQPLMILGVTQPVVIVYIFMYQFLEDFDKTHLFLSWAAWSCSWAALFISIIALTGLCQFINKFTRFCGELFGMLIAVLFIKQTITGLVAEFRVDKDLEDVDRSSDSFDPSAYHWRLVNGLFGVLIALGLLLSTLLLRGARSWRFGRGWLRAIFADYGVPLMVLLWTGVSYALKDTPTDIPRRLGIPHSWDYDLSLKSVKDMLEVDNWLKIAAMLPGLIITILCFFNHNISAKLTQQEAFNLKRPSAYHYDFLLLAFMTLLCGILGIPPTNGTIAQTPMHMKSLASLRTQLIKRESKLQSIRAAKIAAVYTPNTIEDTHTTNQTADVQVVITATTQKHKSKAPPPPPPPKCPINLAGSGRQVLEIKEQRLSNLFQSILLGSCLATTPVLQKIPNSVLWGYFAYMAIVNLPGSEFWDRILLLLTDPKRKFTLLVSAHPAYLETVPEDITIKFTVLQLTLLFVVWGITFAGFYGIFFPIVILLMVPSRQYLLPKFFKPEHLYELDKAEYEEAPAVSHGEAVESTLPAGIPEDEVLRQQLDQQMVGATFRRRLTREEIIWRRNQAEISVQIRSLENEECDTVNQ